MRNFSIMSKRSRGFCTVNSSALASLKDQNDKLKAALSFKEHDAYEADQELVRAGNFKKTMRSHIERISADIHIPVTAVRAKALYSMYEKKESLSCGDILRQFTPGTVIEN